jgi:NADPH:quinone reductase-like Zn-dependent oxidoreductase
LTFGEGIMTATNGRGVDVVLNSLTSAGFKETSLKICAKNARFVEMSKLNIWKVEEVKELRPDVKYSVEDLSSAKEDVMEFLLGEFGKYLNHPVHPLKVIYLIVSFN